MATTVGRTDPALVDALYQEPWKFDFFQGVRLLGLMHPDEGSASSGAAHSVAALVRFRAHQSMQFSASAIQHLEAPEPGRRGPAEMTVNFMGLSGSQGVLPAHYTEHLISCRQTHDEAASAFFDIFNDRLISLFYLAWEKYHFPVAYERECRTNSGPAGFTQYLLALAGTGRQDMLFYGSLLAQRPHSASGLEGILRDYFQLPVTIDQFVGEWCALEDDDLCYLGLLGVHSQLGCGAVVGDRLWNPQARFRICVGPLDWIQFNRFLPDGPAFLDLIAIAKQYVSQPLPFDVQLSVLTEKASWCWCAEEPESMPRLGLSSWLWPDTADSEIRQVVFSAHGG